LLVTRLTFDADYLRWEFEQYGRQPLPWIVRAKGLAASADLLYSRYEVARALYRDRFRMDRNTGLPVNDPRPLTPDELVLFWETPFGPIACMLIGLALENMAKGLMVHGQPGLVTGDGLSNLIKKHDLPSLVASVGIVLDAEQREGLSLLTDYVVWAGRYPIPGTPMAAVTMTDRTDTFHRKPLGDVPSLWEVGRRAFETLAAQARTAIGDALDI
jgi:hypothetical protein